MSAYLLVYSWYALIGCFTLVIGWFRSLMLYWRRRGVPHNEPAFLFGNLNGVATTRHLCETLQEAYDSFKHSKGPFCGFYYLVKPAALVTDLDLTRDILIRDFNNFDERGVYYNRAHDPLTAHLFSANAPEWRKLREKFTPIFAAGKMQLMFPAAVQVGEELSRVCAAEQSVDSELEMQELLARYTTDVIGNCIFGLECNSLSDPEAEFRVMSRHISKQYRHGFLVRNLMQCFPNLARRLRMCELRSETRDFYFRIVRETIARREQKHIKRNDFLNMLIELKNSSDEQTRLNMTELTANAFQFFVKGFETCTSTLSFALYELSQQSAIQQKLRAEIVDVLGKYNGEFTYEAMQKMRYLDQVVAETLRKYAVLPFLQRVARLDYDTGKPGFIIEHGTMVIIPTQAIHHDPEIYPEPEKFKPERFNAEEMRKRHAVDWLPFGDGPRNCIGMRFGQIQIRIALVALLKNFKFTPCERTPQPMVYDEQNVLLTPKQGLYLRVEKL